MDELIKTIREEVKTSKNYNNQLNKIDLKLKSDDLLKVCLSELRENLFDFFLTGLNDKNFKQKNLIITGIHIVLRDCEHWKQDSPKEKDQLINQLLNLIEESIFNNQNESIKIDLIKVLLETSCINTNAIKFDNLIRIINLSSKLIRSNQSNESSLLLAIYMSINQIIENFILYFDENDDNLKNVSIKNGYLCDAYNCDNTENDLFRFKFNKFKNVNLERLDDKFLNLVCFLIDQYEKTNEIELKYFYLNSILTSLKCCSTDQQKVLIKLTSKLNNFLIDKFADFIFKILEYRVPKQTAYFKLELKKNDLDKNADSKTDKKFNSNEKLIKLIYLICEETFKIFSEFRCLRPTLVSITFKMCSSDDNQFYLLKCINRIFRNHLLIFKLFYLMCRNEILIDTSIIKILLDSNKKSYHSISTINSTVSNLASQSIININILIESFNQIIKEFTFPQHILNYRKLSLETTEYELKRIDCYDNLNQDFENYQNKLDNLLKSDDEDSLNLDENQISKQNDQSDQNNDIKDEFKKRNDQNDINDEIKKRNDKEDNQIDESSNDESESNSFAKELDQNKLQSQNVLKFVYFLKNNLADLIKSKNIIKIDVQIQRLSSEFCNQIDDDLIINADGIYSAIYCSLSLNYQLFYNHFCDNKCDINKLCDKASKIGFKNQSKKDKQHFKNEEQFIDEIHKCGLIVFLSTKWIKELYQQLMKINLFDNVLNNIDNRDLINLPLIKLILDLDNQSIYELIDYHKLVLNLDQNKLDLNKFENSTDRIHKLILMNELFDCIWSYLLNNLSFTLRKDLKSIEKVGHNNDQDLKQINLELVFNTIKSSEQLIQIIYKLDQTEKCLEIFDLFLATILIDLDENLTNKPINLTIFQVSAIDIILKYSIQLSCDCPFVWKYVFSCSNYVSNIEHKYFTDKLNKSHNQNLQKYSKILKNLPGNLSKKLNRSPKKDKNSLNLGDLLYNMDKFNENLNDLNTLNNNVDALTKFDTLTGSNNSINLITDCDLLNEFSFDYTDFNIDKIDEYCNKINNQKNVNDKFIDPQTNLDENQRFCKIIQNALYASKLTVNQDDFEVLINHLCKKSTKIFEDSALKLNLKYLICFLEQLISNSNRQLYSISNNDKTKTNLKPSSIKSIKIFNYNCLLFDKFCDVIIRIFKSSRPIFHLMKSLQLATEHLIEAASFEYSEKVRKTSISTLNDLISNFLLNHLELEHFHFNESLFKPYETLLLLELCEMDIQEMIISSINGFVEGFENEIGSGWRSIFRALCGVRLLSDDNLIVNQNNQLNYLDTSMWSEKIECIRQLRVIVDIFDSFLKIRNFDVFNQGAIDCLNCLFKMLKKSTISDLENLDLNELKTKNAFINLNLISLKCLYQFHTTLQEFYSQDNLMINHRPYAYSVPFKRKMIQINHHKLDLLNGELNLSKDEKEKQLNLKEHLIENEQNLEQILEDWYVYNYYLNGLSLSIEYCTIDHQSKVIEIFLSSLNYLIKDANCEFAIYSINHFVFQTIQNWSKSIDNKFKNQLNESDLVLNKIEFSNYKHFCIMITNLIVEFLKQTHKSIKGTNLLIYQFYVLFTQLLIEDHNFMISTLSVSCLKHVFKESTKYLNSEQFDLIFYVIKTICQTSLESFQKLINFFTGNGSKDENRSTNKNESTDNVTNEITDLNLIGKLINDQDNSLELETELAYQLLMQSYLNNQMELTDSGHLTKLYSFDIENETFTISKIIKKLLFLDFVLKEVGGLILNTFKSVDYKIKEFTSFEFDLIEINDQILDNQTNLIKLISDIHLVFSEIEANFKVKFLIQKISMFKPLINFYQINSVCFVLRFFFFFNQLKTDQMKTESSRKEIINKLKELIEKMIDDYINFKIERKLLKLDDLNCSELIEKLTKNEANQEKIEKLKKGLDDFEKLIDRKRLDYQNLNDKHTKNSLNILNIENRIDFDTECYLMINDKIINALLDLQIKTEIENFENTISCFMTMNYYLLICKNNEFVSKLYKLLN